MDTSMKVIIWDISIWFHLSWLYWDWYSIEHSIGN